MASLMIDPLSQKAVTEQVNTINTTNYRIISSGISSSPRSPDREVALGIYNY